MNVKGLATTRILRKIITILMLNRRGYGILKIRNNIGGGTLSMSTIKDGLLFLMSIKIVEKRHANTNAELYYRLTVSGIQSLYMENKEDEV